MSNDPGASADSAAEPAGAEGPIIRDRRKIDPDTGAVRQPVTAEGSSPVTEPTQPQNPTTDPDADVSAQDEQSTAAQNQPTAQVSSDEQPGTDVAADSDAGALHDELLRERAAFHNYRELMKRERPKDREQAIGSVVESLLPVLDDIYLAEQHGDLKDSPFEKIAAKLEATLGKFGVERFGEIGEAFDPQHHEALMHIEAEVPEGSEGTTVVQVMQPGFRVGDRVVRPARVAVADPE